MPRTATPRLALAALALLCAPAALADVFVVRPKPGASTNIAATLSSKQVGERFCNPLHCIVTSNTTPEKAALSALAAAGSVTLEPLPDAHKVLFENAVFDGDTGSYSKDFPGRAETPSAGSTGLFVVMFKAFPEADWLNEIISLGGVPVAFMPSMSYIVYGPRNLRGKLASKSYVFRVEETPAGIKRAGLDDAGLVSAEEVSTFVSIVNVSTVAVKDRIAKSHGGNPPTSRKDGFLETLEARMTHSEALALSRLPEVVFIARSHEARPSDERSNRIVAGGQPGSGTAAWPSAIGSNATNPHFWDQYLLNLSSQIPTFNLSNQVIAFMDTGVDDGLWECGSRCPPYLRASGTDTCRLIYTNDVTSDFYSYSVGGDPTATRRATDYFHHGTLTTSIAAGFAGAESPGRDTAGYAFSQGIAQGAKVAVSKMFAPTSTQGGCDPDGRGVNWRRFGQTEGQLSPNNPSQLFRYSYVALSGTTSLPDGSPPGPGAMLFNHSWNIDGVTGYDSVAALLDGASYNGLTQFTFLYSDLHEQAVYSRPLPTLNVVSTGNCAAPAPCNPALASDAVLSPATAKNVLSVGATYSDNHEAYPAPAAACAGCNELGTGIDYRAVAPFSRGSGGGRIKPDLVAPGARSYGRRSSAAYFCGDGCNATLGSPSNAYKWSSGTSFAAPVVSGAAALVSEWLSALVRTGGVDSTYWPAYWEYSYAVYPMPSLVKAILLGSAKDLCPTDNCSLPNSSRTMRSAPDGVQGWGGLNLGGLFRATGNYFFGNIVRIHTGNVWTKNLTVVDGSKPVTVTVVWQDSPSTPGTPVDSVLTTDLDLSVSLTGRDAISRTYYGNQYGIPLNPQARDGFSLPNPQVPAYDRNKNNVERVSIRVAEAPAAGGNLTVTVAPFRMQVNCLPGYYCAQPLYYDCSVFVENAH